MAFKVKAVTPPPYNVAAWEKVVSKELRHQAAIVKRMYKRVVRTWSSPKPVFRTEVSRKSPGPRGGEASQAMSFSVQTTNDKFIWTDLGTRAHVIRARRAPMLRFRYGGYSPKTRRRVIGSRKGRAGRRWASKQSVQHPGTKAREFTAEIEKRRDRPFFKAMDAANKKGLRAAQRGR